MENQDIDTRVAELKQEIKDLLAQKKCEFCGAQPCYSGNLCVNCYSRKRRYGSPDYRRRKEAREKKRKKEKMPLEDAIYKFAFGEIRDTGIFPKPFDAFESAEYIINGFDERKKTIIIKRIIDCKTLEKIGVEEGLSKERVRQILAKCKRMMNHPTREKIIRNGISACEEDESRKKQERLENLCGDWTSDTPIEYIGLSTRGYNCLKRANIHTVGDIVSLSGEGDLPGRLLKVRHLGRASVDDIIRKIYGHKSLQ